MSFTIRPATIAASDHVTLVDFQESQISWLSSIGSSDQWGTRSVRDPNSSSSQKAQDWVERSERHLTWENGWCRAYIAEASSGTLVAGLVLDSKAPAYVRAVLPEQDQGDPFVYLAYLISNRHAGEEKQGAATALLNFAKQEVRNLRMYRLCLDCFRGNERKLVRYYEGQGFKAIGDFTAVERDWPGCVLEMRL